MDVNYLNQMFSLEGKVALVTGGHRGIGKMIADGLVKAGCRVYVASRSIDEHLDDRHSLLCDLSSVDSIDTLVGEISKNEQQLHILINNAGYFSASPVADVTPKDWDRVMAVNIKAPFFLIQKLLPLLQAAANAEDPARIVNIGSVAGVMGPSNLAYAYSASKAGLHQMTRNLAADLTPQHITVNAIVPGYFPSDMTDGFFTAQPGLREMIMESTPRGRLGSAEDIAGQIIALCSRSGAFTTGTVTALDGGVLLNN